jgi:hypothetical protein
MKEYDNALECLSAECPSVLPFLSDIDRDILDGALAWDSIVLRVSGNYVYTYDRITEQYHDSQTVAEFINETLEWLSEERKYFN